jgi:pyridoxamine 5'-phosphate oxidase
MIVEVPNPPRTPRDLLRSLPSVPAPAWPLDAKAAPETPQALFWEWLQFAVESGVPEPHAMTLSTVAADGHADARVLILKDLDERGWHFSTDAMSPKGRQIKAQPAVALTFYWPKLGRQVRIRGAAVALGEAAGQADFRARSLSARAIALIGRQSQPLAAPEELDTRLASMRRCLSVAPDTYAPCWSVYAVAPDAVEFWQGDRDRRHLRLSYRRQATWWRRQMLWP